MNGSKKLRWVGALLVLAGVAINQWSLAQLFAPDKHISADYKLALIVFFQSACILAGVALWSRWPRTVFSDGALVSKRVVAAMAIGLLSSAIAFSSWGYRVYNRAHRHTVHMDHGMAPTAEQEQWAQDIYLRSLEAAKRNGWFDFDKARADGFEKLWKDRAHYYNEEFIFDDALLDPERPEFLMYLDSPQGKVLLGYMFLVRSADEKGPELGGPLARWHFHPWAPEGRCLIEGLLPVGRPDENGECAEGDLVMRSAEMLHVYFVDHPLGTFADGMVFPEKKSVLEVTLLHPFFVHFTIALFTIAVLLDVVGKVTGSAKYHSAAWINLLFAGVFGIATVAAGLAAEVNLLISPSVHMTLTTHKRLGFAVLASLMVLLVWRGTLRGAFPARGWILYLLIAITGTGLTAAAGYYGAELVYVEGVAVQAVDRNALEGHKRRVFGEYRMESLENRDSDRSDQN